MCNSIIARFFGCGGDHITFHHQQCLPSILNDLTNTWAVQGCVMKTSENWTDDKCPVCHRLSEKKLARLLKNPAWTYQHFSAKDVTIQPWVVVKDMRVSKKRSPFTEKMRRQGVEPEQSLWRWLIVDQAEKVKKAKEANVTCETQ